MSLPLRWTEQAAEQLGSIAEYISLTSPVYAEQVVDRIVLRLRQAQDLPESGAACPRRVSWTSARSSNDRTGSSTASARP